MAKSLTKPFEERVTEFSLLDIKWRAYIFTVKEYEKLIDDSSAATTYFDSKQIVFKLDEFNHTTIRHELMHALIHGSVGSTTLDAHDLEEVVCEQFGQHAPKLMRLSTKIYKDLSVFLKNIKERSSE